MRRILSAIGLVTVLVTVAWAVVYPLPSGGRARVVAVVNELGQVIFGTVPGKVEVTNFPPPTNQVEVTNLPAAQPGGVVFTVQGTTECPAGFTTTVVGTAYTLWYFPGNALFAAPIGCWTTLPSVGDPQRIQPLGPCAVCVR